MAYSPFIQAFSSYIEPLAQIETVTRWPVMLLAVLLATIVYRWAKDLWGRTAGLLALTALVFDPTLVAHSRLATTDLGITFLGTCALYAAWRWSVQPTWRWTLLTGTVLGLTLLAKISGPLWGLGVAAMMGISSLQKRSRKARDSMWHQALIAACVSGIVFWAGYGFTWGQVSGISISLPAPAHWESSRYLATYTSPFFALGQRRSGRWWWYFPLAFLIKNPLPLLLAWTLGLVTLVQQPLSLKRISALGVFPLLYTGVAIVMGMNIGYRHMLPVHPFLHIVLGGGVWRYIKPTPARHSHHPPTPQQSPPLHNKLRLCLMVTLGVWYIVSVTRVFPNELAYFNALVGGPSNGYRYLADSNVEWGQSARALEAYLQTHPDARISPPETAYRPAPGQYIVNASYLQGLGIGDPQAYAWFRHWSPEETLRYSLLVYDVPPYKISWMAQCEVPSTPLDQAAISKGIGTSNLRTVTFDCTQAWLYPAEEATSGIYALHHELVTPAKKCAAPFLLPCPPVPKDPFIARRLSEARLSFEQAKDGPLPAFVLYEATGADRPVTNLLLLYTAPITAVPHINTFRPMTVPLTLEGPLDFLGAYVFDEEADLEIETWWQVKNGPITRPFSIMAHLVTGQAMSLGTEDGLGVWPLTLEAGDVIVQRHLFSSPLPDQALWLRAGIYWLTPLEQWSVADQPQADALWLPLPRQE